MRSRAEGKVRNGLFTEKFEGYGTEKRQSDQVRSYYSTQTGGNGCERIRGGWTMTFWKVNSLNCRMKKKHFLRGKNKLFLVGLLGKGSTQASKWNEPFISVCPRENISFVRWCWVNNMKSVLYEGKLTILVYNWGGVMWCLCSSWD